MLRIPGNLDLAAAAPLLCAGITTYSPLKHWGVGPGKKVGVVGLGGLGHMGVKFAHALGAHTVVFTTSPGKAADARKLGADEVVISTDADQMAKHAGSFDFILDCVAAQHDINAYIALLKRDGNITMVGAPDKPLPVAVFGLLFGRRSLSGSAIGGIAETQEMLDFCGKHNIVSDVEVVGVHQINDAYSAYAQVGRQISFHDRYEDAEGLRRPGCAVVRHVAANSARSAIAGFSANLRQSPGLGTAHEVHQQPARISHRQPRSARQPARAAASCPYQKLHRAEEGSDRVPVKSSAVCPDTVMCQRSTQSTLLETDRRAVALVGPGHTATSQQRSSPNGCEMMRAIRGQRTVDGTT